MMLERSWNTAPCFWNKGYFPLLNVGVFYSSNFAASAPITILTLQLSGTGQHHAF